MICFAVFLAFVCYFYDILRKGAPLLMLLLGVGDGYRLLKYGQSLPPGDGFVEHTAQYDIL